MLGAIRGCICPVSLWLSAAPMAPFSLLCPHQKMTISAEGRVLETQGTLCASNRLAVGACTLQVYLPTSGRQDLNLRSPAPKAGALAKLRHAPLCTVCCALRCPTRTRTWNNGTKNRSVATYTMGHWAPCMMLARCVTDYSSTSLAISMAILSRSAAIFRAAFGASFSRP